MLNYELLAGFYKYHWHDYTRDYLPLIQSLASKHFENKKPITVTDLGCGTGHLILDLWEYGFQCTGVDLSSEMIREANSLLQERLTSRTVATENLPQFSVGNMLDVRLAADTNIVVIAYDAINYLQGKEQVQQLFHHIESQLQPGALLIFDMNTPLIYRMFHDVSERYIVPGGTVTQSTKYDAATRTGHTEFLFEIEGTVQRENHVQAVYSIREMKMLLRKSGLEILSVLDDFDGSPAYFRTQKPIFISRKGRSG